MVQQLHFMDCNSRQKLVKLNVVESKDIEETLKGLEDKPRDQRDPAIVKDHIKARNGLKHLYLSRFIIDERGQSGELLSEIVDRRHINSKMRPNRILQRNGVVYVISQPSVANAVIEEFLMGRLIRREKVSETEDGSPILKNVVVTEVVFEDHERAVRTKRTRAAKAA